MIKYAPEELREKREQYEKNDKRRSYYMLLLPTDSSSIIGIEKVMLEFSDKQSKTLISHGRLNELGEIMIKENAVNILSEYFS